MRRLRTESRSLFLPGRRNIHKPGQGPGGDVGRLAAIQDRVSDSRRQEGQRQNAADIGTVDGKLIGEIND